MGKKSAGKIKRKTERTEPVHPSVAQSRSVFSNPLLHVLAIIIVVCISYSNTLNVPFQFDDESSIEINPAVKDLSYFADTSKIDRSGLTPGTKAIFKTRYLGYLTFALNYKVGGLNVKGYHLVNILIHIISSLLVYWLVLLTFSTPYFSGGMGDRTAYVDKIPPILPLSKGGTGLGPSLAKRGEGRFIENISPKFTAFFAALLFASHPVQTQAITYIVQRFASLATLFYLLALVLYVRWRLIQAGTGKKTPWVKSVLLYVAGLISALMALKTKEFAFTLPVVMVVYELCFFRDGLRRRLPYLIPFVLLILVIPYSLIGGSAGFGAMQDLATKASGALDNISRGDYLLTQFRVIVTYIRLLLLPISQNLDYDYPVYRSFFTTAVFMSFMFLLALFAFAVYLFRSSRITSHSSLFTLQHSPFTYHYLRLIAFGIFWFFITLSAESSIIPIKDVIFEHRLYLPSVGFLIALTASVQLAASRWSPRMPSASQMPVYLMAILALAFTATTYSRNKVWSDKVHIWEDTVKGSPNKARPHNNLGNVYTKLGRYDDAVRQYLAALKMDINYVEAHYNLAFVYARQGRTDDAIREYKEAIKIVPDYSIAHNNLGNIYQDQNRLEDAVNEYKAALKNNPDYAEAHNNLANAYQRQGRLEEAIPSYLTALKLNPDYGEARNNLANAYQRQERYDEAIAEYKAALKINPNYAEAHNGLANTYQMQNRLDDAIPLYKAAIRLKTGYAFAHANLAVAYEKKGRYQEAINELKEVLRIRPDDQNAALKIEMLSKKIRK